MTKDETIKKRVVDQLYWDGRVDASNIEVEVDNGTVTLKGAVPNYTTRHDAVLDAWFVNGVKKLKNEIEVKYPSTVKLPDDNQIKSIIDNKLFWSPYLNASDIDVSVESGFVKLEGTVDSYWKKKRVEEITSMVDGIYSIENKLAVVPSESIVDKTIADWVVDAMDRNMHVDPDNVTVRVEDSIVTLTGTVSDWLEYRAAMNAAEYTTGVTDVIDLLKIE